MKQGKVNLTWDETDPNRLAAMRKAFDDDDNDDVRAYLANSSDEDDEQQDLPVFGSEQEEDIGKKIVETFFSCNVNSLFRYITTWGKKQK